MRLYARHASGTGDLRIDLLQDNPIQAVLPEPDSPQDPVLIWHQPPLLLNGQPGNLQLELHLLSGQLSLADQQGNTLYVVIKGRDSDRLRVQLYQYVLDTWFAKLQHQEIHRTGLDRMEQLRSQIYRLQDSLAQPDSFLYQFL